MSSIIASPKTFIDIIHNGVERGCPSCAFRPPDIDLEPCLTCNITSEYTQWLLDPSYLSDEGGSAPANSGMLPQQQRIGYITVAEAVNALKTYSKKDDVSTWYKLILLFIIELQKLQEDSLIPAPSSKMSDKGLNEWLINLQQYCRQQELQKELQLEQQKSSAGAVPVHKTSEVKPSPVVVVTVVPELAQSVALPIQENNKSTPHQPAFVFDYPAMLTVEMTEFTDFVQRMKNIADDILVKLCQIASDFGKLSIQNAEGRLTNEKYNQMTDDQERRVKEIAPTAKFDYNTCQILIGDQPIPEIAKSQFVKPQEQGKLAPAPRHGPKL